MNQTLSDWSTTKPKEFYDTCEFYVLNPDKKGLETLLGLATDDCIFVGEPTGSYSLIWVENVRLHGDEFRLIPDDKVASGRQAECNWKDKDDWHEDQGQGSAILQTVEKLAAENPEDVKVVRDAIAQIKNPLTKAVAALLEQLADKGNKSDEATEKASRALSNLIQARISDLRLLPLKLFSSGFQSIKVYLIWSIGNWPQPQSIIQRFFLK